MGQFVWGSNYTFLVTLDHPTGPIPAVYKPAQGERPLWDFPNGTLASREAAAFLCSQALGWDLVPPTVLRNEGPLGRARSSCSSTPIPRSTTSPSAHRTNSACGPWHLRSADQQRRPQERSHLALAEPPHLADRPRRVLPPRRQAENRGLGFRRRTDSQALLDDLARFDCSLQTETGLTHGARPPALTRRAGCAAGTRRAPSLPSRFPAPGCRTSVSLAIGVTRVHQSGGRRPVRHAPPIPVSMQCPGVV